jgi:hypothetical protein
MKSATYKNHPLKIHNILSRQSVNGLSTATSRPLPGKPQRSGMNKITKEKYQLLILEHKNIMSDVETSYLNETGWKLTCDNPAHRWMWEKTINGKVLVMNQEDAVDLEDYIH